MLKPDDNIILIGMPGVGKSTVGVLSAKATGRNFIDTDVYIQAGDGRSLQEILDTAGTAEFCRIEEQYLLCLEVRRHVVATGGSAVYSEPAMTSLKRGGVVVHLDLPLAEIEHRLADLAVRGVVMAPGQSLATLYEQRQPLYRRWADVTIDCMGMTQDQVVGEVLRKVGGRQ